MYHRSSSRSSSPPSSRSSSPLSSPHSTSYDSDDSDDSLGSIVQTNITSVFKKDEYNDDIDSGDEYETNESKFTHKYYYEINGNLQNTIDVTNITNEEVEVAQFFNQANGKWENMKYVEENMKFVQVENNQHDAWKKRYNTKNEDNSTVIILIPEDAGEMIIDYSYKLPKEDAWVFEIWGVTDDGHDNKRKYVLKSKRIVYNNFIYDEL